MTVVVANRQAQAPVRVAAITRLARQALRRLKISGHGQMAITFIDDARMKTLNRRFKGHDRFTDVLSFRYDGEPVAGEILIAPRQAQRYARAHQVPYREELARYVVHGLLHWLGHEDRTRQEQQRMRRMEDTVLAGCGIRVASMMPRRPSARRAGGASKLKYSPHGGMGGPRTEGHSGLMETANGAAHD